MTSGITPHPNLVQTFGVSLDGPNPCIVLEFCGGGSLDTIVFDREKHVTSDQKRDYALKIAYGLLHLHNNNIIHRDLAARNILVSIEIVVFQIRKFLNVQNFHAAHERWPTENFRFWNVKNCSRREFSRQNKSVIWTHQMDGTKLTPYLESSYIHNIYL